MVQEGISRGVGFDERTQMWNDAKCGRRKECQSNWEDRYLAGRQILVLALG